jgi:hypothetical protein
MGQDEWSMVQPLLPETEEMDGPPLPNGCCTSRQQQCILPQVLSCERIRNFFMFSSKFVCLQVMAMIGSECCFCPCPWIQYTRMVSDTGCHANTIINGLGYGCGE